MFFVKKSSRLCLQSGQKPITLEEIAKYQEYTKDSENILSIDKEL